MKGDRTRRPAPPGPWVAPDTRLPRAEALVEVELYRGDGHDGDVVRAYLDKSGLWFVKLNPGDLAFRPLPGNHSVLSWREANYVRGF